MLDFPNIEAPAAAPAPQPAAVEQTRAISAGIVQVQGEVAKFDQIALGLAAIEAAHPKNVIVAAIDTPAGMKAAEAAWRAYRNPRLEVERARKAAKAPVLALGKAIDTFAGSLEDRLREGETHYKAQIDREEERREAIRQEQARIEREAQERHAARLQVIAGYLLRCQEVGMTAERIARGIQMLTDSDVSDTDAARAEALAGAKARALEQMQVLHAQAVAREAEAARQEAIRLENERVAAELAAERQRIADEAAAVRRAAEELAAREAAARAAEAKAAEDQRLAELAKKIADENAAVAQRAAEFQAERAALAAPVPVLSDKAVADANCRAWLDRICPDDPDAAPHTTAAEMGGDRADPGEAAGLAEVNPEPATVKESLTAEPTPADTLRALAAEARASRVPTNPKMGPEWWARWFAAVDALEVA
jgi:hypothetical protein